MAITGAGLIVLAPGASALTALGWVWPPLLLALVVWMTVHSRRQPSSRLQPWLLYPVFGVLALAAIGGGYETLGNATDRAVAPVAGSRLLDVGGHRLSIRCTGSGSPTVVLEPGLGESASAMARWIAPDVARTTTVCVYDRAGHGRSDPAPAGGPDAARDLHVLAAPAGAHRANGTVELDGQLEVAGVVGEVGDHVVAARVGVGVAGTRAPAGCRSARSSPRSSWARSPQACTSANESQDRPVREGRHPRGYRTGKRLRAKQVALRPGSPRGRLLGLRAARQALVMQGTSPV